MKKKNKIWTIVLIILYISSLVGIYFALPKYNEEDYIKKENDFEITEVDSLEKYLEGKDFKNLTKDEHKVLNNTIKTNIFNGRVTVTITVEGVQRKYFVSDIGKVKSTRSFIYEDNKKGIPVNFYEDINALLTKKNREVKLEDLYHVTYMLTEKNKIYYIVDNLKELKETENYEGKEKELEIVNVSEFTMITKTFKPYVIVKASEGRVFTNMNGVIKEIVEHKEEEK